MLRTEWFTFSQLSVEQLYAVLQLRNEVFIVEQQCLYNDIDGIDPVSLHCLGYDDHHLAAYCRLILPNASNKQGLWLGRVITAQRYRNLGYGKELVAATLAYCHTHFPQEAIHCSAQFYLKKFYESFGFEAVGLPFEEDGILHVRMIKKA